jgi:zinc transport system substrate-binding protein
MNRLLSLLLLLGALPLAACDRRPPEPKTGPQRLQVVTTLFPLYDFARAVGGGRVEATLLLPPGVEPHGFEPKPDDVLRIYRADLFVYTHPAMEPWAARVVAGLDPRRVAVVDASAGARLLPAETGDGHDHGHEAQVDPHLWLDFDNARLMVGNIAAALAARDPARRDLYLADAAAYQAQLAALDQKYRTGLADCRGRVLLQGGHFTFGYLARRYGLSYRAAAAVNPAAEPTPERLAELVRQLRASGLHAVFSEELVAPRVAETIARETGASVLPLSGGHNVGRDELAQGITFLALMERNLENLRKGLECR